MHHAGIGRVAVFLGQNTRHVVIGCAGVNDQRQAGALGRLDMDAQGLLLHFCAVGGIVIVQSGFTDAHEFRVLCQTNQFIDGCHRLVRRAHRVRAGGIEDGCMRLGNGTDAGFIAQACADCDHAGHAVLSAAHW